MKTNRPWFLTVCALALLAAFVSQTFAQADKAKAKDNAKTRALSPLPYWIWVGEPKGDQTVYLRSDFKLPADLDKVKAIMLIATCDNVMTVYINGKKVAQSDEWQSPVRVDITKQVKAGDNSIAVEAMNQGAGAAGFIAQIELKTQTSRENTILVSDKTWLGSPKATAGWNGAEFDAKKAGWTSASALFPNGGGPWKDVLSSAGAAAVAQSGQKANAPEGFKVDLIYTVPKATQGSWVALTTLPDGRLIA
ncbi:MAG: sugar-binding domain-containing protein, partial [Phycisphaeraceae bacterium]